MCPETRQRHFHSCGTDLHNVACKTFGKAVFKFYSLPCHPSFWSIAKSSGKSRVIDTPRVPYVWLMRGSSRLAISSTHQQKQQQLLLTLKPLSEIKCRTVSFVMSQAWIYGELHWCKDKVEGREREDGGVETRGVLSLSAALLRMSVGFTEACRHSESFTSC